MPNQLDQLRERSIIVADTGDIHAISEHKPSDATTNPSLLLKAAQQADYAEMLNNSIATAKAQNAEDISLAQDLFTAALAKKILGIIPGYLSVEVDARLSFDTEKTLARTHVLLERLNNEGVDTSRILIKVAGTWQGIQAAKVLEAQGIKCNVTLLFDMAQVIACAQANAFLISPFVGRIYDWYVNNGDAFEESTDPGVLYVKNAYQYLKARGSDTITMAASFRKTYQILALAGCDRQTISPNLLSELAASDTTITTAIDDTTLAQDFPQSLTESEFYWMFNQNPMAVEKLADGIRRFAQDQETLDALLSV